MKIKHAVWTKPPEHRGPPDCQGCDAECRYCGERIILYKEYWCEHRGSGTDCLARPGKDRADPGVRHEPVVGHPGIKEVPVYANEE